MENTPEYSEAIKDRKEGHFTTKNKNVPEIILTEQEEPFEESPAFRNLQNELGEQEFELRHTKDVSEKIVPSLVQ